MENAPQVIDQVPDEITIALHSKDRPFLQASLDELARFDYIYQSECKVTDQSDGIFLRLGRQHKKQNEGPTKSARVIVTGEVPWEKDPFGGDWHDEMVPQITVRFDRETSGARPIILRRSDVELPDFLFPAVVPDHPRITFCNVIDAFRSPERVPAALCEKLGILPIDSLLKMAEALLVQSSWSLGLLFDLAKESPSTSAEALLTIDSTLDRQEAALLAAISQRDEVSTREVLQALGRPVSSVRFSGGNTLLHFAACFPNSTETERALLDAGADPNAKSVVHATPLHFAVWNPPNEQILLDRDADPCAVSLEGDSALNVAAWLGNIELVPRLLDAGAHAFLTDKNGGHAFSWAAQAGSVEVLQRILSQYPDSIDVRIGAFGIGSQDPEFGAGAAGLPALVRLRRYRAVNNPILGSTSLMTAAFAGAKEAVQFVLTRGARPNSSSRSGLRALHYAVGAKEYASEIVYALLQSGADPDARDQEGNTALILAAIAGRIDCVSILAKEGANINAVDENGLTALHYAAQAGNTELITSLFQWNASPSLLDKKGFTPLHHAIFFAGPDVEIIRALVKGGSRVDEKTRDGRKPFLLIALSKRSDADRRAIADCLLELGTDPNEIGPSGHSLLSQAVGTRDIVLVEALLEKGAAIRREGSTKTTALHAAVIGGHDHMVEKLLKAGADPNCANAMGETALHEAVRNKRAKAWELLLENGGDPLKPDKDGQCAVVAAALEGYDDFCVPILQRIDLLRPKSPQNGPVLICAAALGNTELVGQLLKAGVSPDYASGDGWRPVSAAALRGYAGTVERLLEAGAKVNWAVATPTALCCAVVFGDLAMVRRFLELKADPNAPAMQGRGPLHFAAERENTDVLKELIKAGSFVDAREKGGRTALHMAASAQKSEAAELLLRAGANPQALDGNGDSPLHLAIASEASEVVRVLLEQDDRPDLLDERGQSAIVRAPQDSFDEIITIFREKGRDPGLVLTSRRETQRSTELARFLDWRPVTTEQCNALANDSNLAEGLDRAANDILTAELRFLDQTSVLAVGDPSRREQPNQRFHLWSHRLRTTSPMNWTNGPIYSANEAFGFKLTKHASLEAVRQYTLFFFFFVRGHLGRFNLVEKRALIPWRPGTPDLQKQEVANQLMDIQFAESQFPMSVTVTTTVLFKNALFKTNFLISLVEQDLTIDPDEGSEHFTIGQGKLFGEKLLAEDLDVEIDGPAGEFG